jgi:hypothetical protein
MIPADMVTLGVTFYDRMREHGAADFDARHVAVCYMRRKAPDGSGDAMPYYEALADVLAWRASARIVAAQLAIIAVGCT